jgi:hypothetical protein
MSPEHVVSPAAQAHGLFLSRVVGFWRGFTGPISQRILVLRYDCPAYFELGYTKDNPAINELRKLVQSGDLGKIYCVEAERVNLGPFRRDINLIWDLAAHVQSHIHDMGHLDLSFANAIRMGIQPRAHGGAGLEMVRILAAAQEVLEKQERPNAALLGCK